MLQDHIHSLNRLEQLSNEIKIIRHTLMQDETMAKGKRFPTTMALSQSCLNLDNAISNYKKLISP